MRLGRYVFFSTSRLLTPSTSTLSRMADHHSMFVYTPLFYWVSRFSTALAPPRFSTGVYNRTPTL
jgi:hypothetical protein